jgi:hypothetical protein
LLSPSIYLQSFVELAPSVVEGGERRFWDRFWQNRSDLGANKEGEPP